ncbi:hypothetical protein A142_18015 [Vibrio splendidus 12E03]|uniref:Uncharacterized protein n=1 Tax=Vibrio splendidus 12E03 TaxID=1191305 RepID=A0A1E5FVS8_VIBSP|nr:hypothetical protein A142_18015 [Vibrio splendidus 12E03]
MFDQADIADIADIADVITGTASVNKVLLDGYFDSIAVGELRSKPEDMCSCGVRRTSNLLMIMI